MTCDRRALSHYRDGVLDFDERYELERHLQDCAACTQELRGLMRLAQVVRSLPMEPAPTALRREVYRLATERDERRRQPARLAGIGRALAPATVAAAVAVAALVTFRPGALDLANRPVPVEVAASSSVGEAAAQAAVSSASTGSGSATANVPKTNPGALAVAPSMRVAVSAADTSGLPVKGMNAAAVPEPIARLYATNMQIHDLLGAPSPGSRTVTLLEQSFQGGLAIWRSSPEIKNRLGWAVYEPRGSGGSIQTFEHGLVVWTPHGFLYVLSNDGRWRTFPDASQL